MYKSDKRTFVERRKLHFPPGCCRSVQCSVTLVNSNFLLASKEKKRTWLWSLCAEPRCNLIKCPDASAVTSVPLTQEMPRHAYKNQPSLKESTSYTCFIWRWHILYVSILCVYRRPFKKSNDRNQFSGLDPKNHFPREITDTPLHTHTHRVLCVPHGSPDIKEN